MFKRKSIHGMTAMLVHLAVMALFLNPHGCLGEEIEASPEAVPKRAYVIPLSGTVEPAMAAFIKRVFRDTENTLETLYILEIDTYGGRVDSALEIVDTLLAEPKGKTVAFVKTKAISAGALIALACNRLVMAPNSTIGDCAPIIYSSEGPKVMGEKFQSPLRAKFRTLARRNGYPETLAESMVTEEMDVVEVVGEGGKDYMTSREYEELPDAEKKKFTRTRTIVGEGELLTMDDAEAMELGFAAAKAETLQELLEKLGYQDMEIMTIEKNWSEHLGVLISLMAPILMMLGLASLYTEMKSPGFGIAGILGLACLGLVLFHQYIVGLADHTELILIAIGISLLAAEVFVLPGFGIAGISGFAFIAIGLILSLQDFVIPDPTRPWQRELLITNSLQVLASFVFAFFAGLFALRYIIPRFGGRFAGPYLAATLEQSRAVTPDSRNLHVGQRGRAVTLLRPAGKVEIDGERHDAISEGEFIEKGAPIVIESVHGNRIVVRKGETP